MDEGRRKRAEGDAPPEDNGVRKIVLVAGDNGKQTLVISEGGATIIPSIKGYRFGEYALIDGMGNFDGKLEGIDVPLHQMVVKKVLSPGEVQCEMAGNKVVVIKHPKMGVAEGDVIGVDMKHPIMIKVYPKEEEVHEESFEKVAWEQVIGQREAVAQLREIADGFENAALADFYNRSLPKGTLLWGPPGCGKTMLAKALATGLGGDGSFFSIRGPEILDKWVGNSEARAREFFAAGEAFFDKTGKKAVLFIDEADAILQKRGQEHNSVITNTLVPQFLTLMDGMKESKTFVILATNRPDTLDPAIVREGRIDVKIKIARPDREIGKEIVKAYLTSRPLDDAKEMIAEAGMAMLFSTALGTVKGGKSLLAGHYMSGALGATMVEQAAARAYERDRLAKKRSGIKALDMVEATKKIIEGLVNRDHTDVIHEHGLA